MNLFSLFYTFLAFSKISNSQFPGSSLFNFPWSQSYGQPIRPTAYGYGGSPAIGSFVRPSISANSPAYDDDPLPPESVESVPPPQFPPKLRIKAPNGVVEIYNRVVDDLIRKLKVDFENADIDPMPVVIRSTPQGPVRVPGHLQKRPFRRPGAALYRSNQQAENLLTPLQKRNGDDFWQSSESVEHQVPVARRSQETPRSGSPKPTTTEGAAKPQREPAFDEYPASDENLSEEVKVDSKAKPTVPPKPKVKTKPVKVEDEDDEEADVGGKGGSTVLQNRKGNVVKKNGGKFKNEKITKTEENKKKVSAPYLEEDQEEDPPGIEDEDEQDDFDDSDPGSSQEADRPTGGYYPKDGGPPLPSKPNAELHGLSRMMRASDVVVGVDARSAVVTARLMVGPLVVHINESTEPMERGVKATIPELEAEIILMERHGVIFLQRFTLDRAYGQDIEISVPKVKSRETNKKKKTGSRGRAEVQPGFDSMHPAAIQRFHAKMGAHLSMEVVKLLRSGNLRVKIMRTAQNSMSKLRLPIKSDSLKKTSKKRNKGSKKKNN